MGSSSEEVDPFAELREEEGGGPETVAPSSPPPLPPRRPAAVAARPAMTLPAVRAPSRPSLRLPLPLDIQDAADPFAEPVEPPAPASPAERLEHTRVLLRQKVETLQRARALFAERETELRTARISETTLRGQLVEAQGQLVAFKARSAQKDSAATLSRETARAEVAEARCARLEEELRGVEEDRKDLARSLADVEAELARLNLELNVERESRGSLAEELIGAKEALGFAQDRVSELVAEHIETQGALESVRDEYQATLAEGEQSAEQLRLSERERELIAAERMGLSLRVGQLESMLAESEWSSSSLEEVRARSIEVEAERDGARAESGDLASRLELAEAEVVRLREQMESDAAALGEVVEAAESNVTRLEAELATATADRQDLARALAEVEAELAALRPGDADSLGVEELDEAQRASEAEAEGARLRQRVKMLEGALEVAQRKSAPVPDTGLIAERDRLKEEAATMKRKLVAAELALETAASHKMKVARLEAELAQLRKGR